jgi:pyruvate/2-oxoglutarate dehydrogenase complex dihydrolipoamide dehydrogenase (E3) component
MAPPGTTRDVQPGPGSETTAVRSIDVDVAVLGGGGAAETLAGELTDTGLRVAVIEQDRVGGECPFVACMPSKAMLHDAHTSIRWDDAVTRRDNITEHLDDRNHARHLDDSGAQLVRGRGRVLDPRTIAVGDTHVRAEHIVLATGSSPVIADIDGIDHIGGRLWTSDDALTASKRPARLMVIGGGPIGCELAQLFAGFDTEVHMVDVAERAFPELPDPIGDIVDNELRSAGVRVCRGRQVLHVERRGGNVLTALDNDATVMTDRVLMAVGRRPNTSDLGLEHLGLDAAQPLPVDDRGRVDCPGSVWAMGDVVGRAQYTHLANHHARVIANQLAGDGGRRFGDVVTPASIFTRPPVIMVGPTPAELDDVVWVEARMSEVARWSTDSLGDGFLTVAVDPATRCVVAAHGVGARFDELSAALITAIDGGIPVDRLRRSMWAFPTVAELLGLVFARAADALDAD